MINDKSATLAVPQVYTDLGSLQNLKRPGGDERAQLRQIAEQFEAMMMQMMLKSMRQANAVFSEGNPLVGNEEQFYQEMFDQQLGINLSSSGRGMGIADALMRQLQGRLPQEGQGADREAGRAAIAVQRGEALQAALVPARNAALRARQPGDAPFNNVAPADVLDGDAIWETLESAALRVEQTRSHPVQTQPLPTFDGTPATFVNALLPVAERIGAELGVDSRLLLSQAALETGWGEKMIARRDGQPSYNFFNIKAGRSWDGAVATVPSLEYRNGVAVREWSAFRAYESPEESFADYARLISQNPRYRQALAQADNPRAYMHALERAGYATDPRYAEKVLAVFDGRHLQGGDAGPIDTGTQEK